MKLKTMATPSRNAVTGKRRGRSGFAWLELLLALAFVALLWQFFPRVFIKALSYLDVRDWTRPVCFFLNLLVVIVLLSVRFGPDLVRDWKERKKQRTIDRANTQKKEEIKQQQEAVKRMKEGQSRRRYWP